MTNALDYYDIESITAVQRCISRRLKITKLFIIILQLFKAHLHYGKIRVKLVGFKEQKIILTFKSPSLLQFFHNIITALKLIYIMAKFALS